MVERSRRCTFHIEEPEPPTTNKSKPILEKIWDFLDDPTTSKPAKVFASTYFVVVVISVITSTLETIPAFHEEGKTEASQDK